MQAAVTTQHDVSCTLKKAKVLRKMPSNTEGLSQTSNMFRAHWSKMKFNSPKIPKMKGVNDDVSPELVEHLLGDEALGLRARGKDGEPIVSPSWKTVFG